MLVLLCAFITVLILLAGRDHDTPTDADGREVRIAKRGVPAAEVTGAAGAQVLPEEGAWHGKPYVRVKSAAGPVSVWRKDGDLLSETQTLTVQQDGRKLVNGRPRGKGPGEADLSPVGYASKLPGGVERTGALGPLAFLRPCRRARSSCGGPRRLPRRMAA